MEEEGTLHGGEERKVEHEWKKRNAMHKHGRDRNFMTRVVTILLQLLQQLQLLLQGGNEGIKKGV